MNRDDKGGPFPPRETYYALATTWGTDVYEAMRRSRRLAWILAGGLGLTTIFEALALMLLAPMKSVVPYTLLVDRQTGFVQAVDPTAPTKISVRSALTRAFLAQYVVARESWDFSTAQSDYDKVALWSEGAARTRYIAYMQADDRNSPVTRYGRKGRIVASIRSVSPLGDHVALIRFDTATSDDGGTTRPIGRWAAVVHFRYRDMPMSAADRLVNPLGFTVTAYRKDAELPPSPAGADE